MASEQAQESTVRRWATLLVMIAAVTALFVVGR
jgi:hypothetical protein